MRSEIKSDNLILRKYEMSFAPLLFEAAIESRGGEFTHWMPWCHENYKFEESEIFIKKSKTTGKPQSNSALRFSMRKPKNFLAALV